MIPIFINTPEPRQITYVSVDENILNSDTNMIETVSSIVDMSTIDERLSLHADDFRLESIIDSGNLSQLKDMPMLSLNALSMTDIFSRGAAILENIKSQIKE